MTKINEHPELTGFLLGFCWSDFPYLLRFLLLFSGLLIV